MEAHGGLAGERLGQWAKLAESGFRTLLVEAPDGIRDSGFGIGWRQRRRPLEGRCRRDRPPDSLEADAVQEPFAGTTALGAGAQRVELSGGRQARYLARSRGRGNESRQPARKVWEQEIPSEDRVRRVRLPFSHRTPRGHRIAAPSPKPGQAQVELDDAALRIQLRQLLEPD
jgi:hypothetical protein